jgi:arabinofuranan 3-O-arabinosyltransferase
LHFVPEPARIGSFLKREKTRYLLAWTAAMIGAVICAVCGWFAVREPKRADGNDGHVSLDFSGQWVMGRMVVRGEGRHLYHRDRIRAALEEQYPRHDEAPGQKISDVEHILSAMMGSDDPGTDHIGGALYPPIHGLLYAPLGALPPRVGYRLAQVLNLVLIFVAAGLLSLLAAGRIWWPVAVVWLMLFPGIAGSIGLGQNAPLSLTILAAGWLVLSRGHPGWAGAVWGLLAFKPVWAAAFLLVPVLTRRWRMAGTMVLSGLVLAAATLPFVGWHAWMDWFQVGREATATYNVDRNWIECSRDLLSVARRWFLNFDLPLEERDRLLPAFIGWSLLLAVLATTVALVWKQRRQPVPWQGPGAAFVLLGAWLLCFHFMYYDVLLAALPVFLLFLEPRRWLEPIVVSGRFEDPRKGENAEQRSSNVCLLNRFVPTVWFLLVVTQPLWFKEKWHMPPGETVLLCLLWIWCGWQWRREERTEVPRLASSKIA